MNGDRDSPSIDLDPFLSRVRRGLSHDLRTPLGTISNYATILEYQANASPEDIRIFASRIRSSVQRVANTLRTLSDALALSARGVRATEVDLASLLRSVLAELAPHARFPARGSEPVGAARGDVELLTFAWRAFLSVAVEVKPTQPLDVDLVVVNTHPSTIEMWFGTHNEPSLAGVASVAASQNGTSKSACTDASDPLQFAHLAMSDGASEGCFALGLVEDLLQVRGGKLEMWGSPREAAGMRITLPADL